MPLVNSVVHGEGWAEHHRPVVSQTQTATCSIRKPGGTPGVFDPVTGARPLVPYPPHYSGSCSVEVLSAAEQEVVTGGQEVTMVAYRVTLDFDAAPDADVDDLVTVQSVGRNGDPALAGRMLLVRSFTRGSTVWERELLCTDNLG